MALSFLGAGFNVLRREGGAAGVGVKSVGREGGCGDYRGGGDFDVSAGVLGSALWREGETVDGCDRDGGVLGAPVTDRQRQRVAAVTETVTGSVCGREPRRSSCSEVGDVIVRKNSVSEDDSQLVHNDIPSVTLVPAIGEVSEIEKEELDDGVVVGKNFPIGDVLP